MNSDLYKALVRRLIELRRHMLPEEFSPTGDYEENQRDHALGFRVLAHAEIEHFLEELASSMIIDSVTSWETSGVPNHVMVSFLACYQTGWVTEGEENAFKDSSRIKPKESYKEALNTAIGQYKNTIIKGNNGIKSVNLKNIFVPLGVDFSQSANLVDQVWLNAMQTFGTNRGLSAHKSKRVQTQIDPLSEYRQVIEVAKGLRNFDALISSIKAGVIVNRADKDNIFTLLISYVRKVLLRMVDAFKSSN